MTSPQDDREELEPDVDDGGASTSPGKEQADKESVPVSPEKGAVRRPRTRESDKGAAPGGARTAGADSVAAPAGSGAGSTTSEPGPSVSEAGADTVATPAEPQEAEAVEPVEPEPAAAPGEAEPETTAERPVSEPGPSVSEAGADTVATPAEPQEAEAAEVVEPVEPEPVAAPGEAGADSVAAPAGATASEPGPSVSEAGADTVVTPAEPQEAEPEEAEAVEPVESDTVAAPGEAEPETTAEGPVSEPEEAPAAASAGSAGADTVVTPAEPQEAEAAEVVEPVEPEPAGAVEPEQAEVVEPVEPEPVAAPGEAGADSVAAPAGATASEPGPSVSEAGADTVVTPAEPQEAEPEEAEAVEPVESDTVAAPGEAEPETTAEGPVSEPEEAPAAASAGSAGADTVVTPAEPVEPEPAGAVEPVEPGPAAASGEAEPVKPAPERAASGPEPEDPTSAPEPETTGSEAVGLDSGETESVVAPVRPRKTAPGSPADTDDGRDAAEDHAGRKVSGPETDGGRARVVGTTTAEPETANRIFLADLLAHPLPGEEETAPAAESPDGDAEAPAGEDSDTEGPEAEAEESVDLPPSYPPTRRPRPLPIPGREEDSASEARPRRGWLSTIIVVLVVITLSAFIKTHIIQTFEIPSGSMEDTLQTGDQVAVRMYDAHNIHRGDVVVFSDPGGWLNDAKDPTGLQGLVRNGLILTGLLPKNSGHHLIKRVIGVAGDRVTADGSGALSVNGVSLDETYIKQGSAPSSVPFDVVVPEGCIWVMGDNRSNSSDSRFHQDDPHGGAVPVQDVVGVATVVAWPVSHWESLDEGEAVFKDVPGDSH